MGRGSRRCDSRSDSRRRCRTESRRSSAQQTTHRRRQSRSCSRKRRSFSRGGGRGLGGRSSHRSRSRRRSPIRSNSRNRQGHSRASARAPEPDHRSRSRRRSPVRSRSHNRQSHSGAPAPPPEPDAAPANRPGSDAAPPRAPESDAAPPPPPPPEPDAPKPRRSRWDDGAGAPMSSMLQMMNAAPGGAELAPVQGGVFSPETSQTTQTMLQIMNPAPAGAEGTTMHGRACHTIQVESKLVPIVLGKNGAEIRRIEQTSGAVVQVQHSSHLGSSVCNIFGQAIAADTARDLIQMKLVAASPDYDAHVPEGMVLQEFPVKQTLIGKAMGKGGELLKQIRSTSGAEIQLDKMSEQMGQPKFRLVGPRDKVDKAIAFLRERMGQGMLWTFGENQQIPFDSIKINFKLDQVCVPQVIGKGKEIMNEICQATLTRVEINQSTQDAGFSVVTVQGSEKATHDARLMILQKTMKGWNNQEYYTPGYKEEVNSAWISGGWQPNHRDHWIQQPNGPPEWSKGSMPPSRPQSEWNIGTMQPAVKGGKGGQQTSGFNMQPNGPQSEWSPGNMDSGFNMQPNGPQSEWNPGNMTGGPGFNMKPNGPQSEWNPGNMTSGPGYNMQPNGPQSEWNPGNMTSGPGYNMQPNGPQSEWNPGNMTGGPGFNMQPNGPQSEWGTGKGNMSSGFNMQPAWSPTPQSGKGKGWWG